MLSRMLTMVFVFTLLLSAAVHGEESDPVLAKAGDYAIRKSDFERLISYYPPQNQKALSENPQQKIVLLKRMLEVKLIADIARKNDFTSNLAVKEQLQFLVDDFLAREYLTKEVMKDVPVSDEDITHYYDLNKDKFRVPDQIKARHILVKVPPDAPEDEKKKAREKAEEALKKIGEGEDFAKLAETVSDDPGSKDNGGDLGYFSRSKMVKSFEDAAFSLKPGEVSGIVETNFGLHIIKVEDYKEGKTRSLQEVMAQIREQLQSTFARAKAEEFLANTTKDAGMEIYTEKVLEQAPKK